MSKRKTLHIVPNPNGGWDIKRGGGQRSSGHYDRKTDAINRGRQISRNLHSELYIHNRDGKISRKDSHGGDSYPPPG